MIILLFDGQVGSNLRSVVMNAHPAGSTVYFAHSMTDARNSYIQLYHKPNLVIAHSSVEAMSALAQGLRQDGCQCPILALADDPEAGVGLRASSCSLVVSMVAFIMYSSRFLRLFRPDQTVDDELANSLFLLKMDEEGVLSLPAIVSLPPTVGE